MESLKSKRTRCAEILEILTREYPDSACSLIHVNSFQLLIATILSAQCTDAMVNKVTPTLFARFPDASSMANAEIEDLENLIRQTGFYKNKAKNIKACCMAIMEQHGGEVPQNMKDLNALPGVGRKTANVVLGNAFGNPAGVVVDTHVGRITRLLKFTNQKTAEKIEEELNKIVPQKDWTMFPHLLIDHGRAVCVARRPRCGDCVIKDFCPSCLES